MNKKGLNIKWYELIVAKVYKYFRLVKISFQLRFSINTLPRTAQDIARLPKEVPGMFFEADIFKLSDIAKFSEAGNKFINSQTATEVLSVFPIFIEMILATGERYVIGKLINPDTPLDVFIAPERLVEKKGKSANLYSAVYIQTKRLKNYPARPLMREEWAKELQDLLYKTLKNNDFGVKCEINFRNEIPFSGEINDGGFAEIFRKLVVPKNKHVQGISMSIPVYDTLLKTKTFRTWYIWPKVSPLGNLHESMIKVCQLYAALDAVDMLIKLDKAKSDKLSI